MIYFELLPEVFLHISLMILLLSLSLIKNIKALFNLVKAAFFLEIILAMYSLFSGIDSPVHLAQMNLVINPYHGLLRTVLFWANVGAGFLILYSDILPKSKASDVFFLKSSLLLLGLYLIYSNSILVSSFIMFGQFLVVSLFVYVLNVNDLGRKGVLRFFRVGTFIFLLTLCALAAIAVSTDSFLFDQMNLLEGKQVHYVKIVLTIFTLLPYFFVIGFFPFISVNKDFMEGAYWPAQLVAFALVKFSVAVSLFQYGIQAFSLDTDSWSYIIRNSIAAMAFLSGILTLLAAVNHENVRSMVILLFSSLVVFPFTVFLNLDKNSLFIPMQHLMNFLLLISVVYLVLAGLFRDNDEKLSVNCLNGLGWRYKAQAIIILLALCSAAGVPPLLGFQNFLLFYTVLFDRALLISLFCMILFQVLILLILLRVLKRFFFENPQEDFTTDHTPAMRYSLAILLLAPILVLGFMDFQKVSVVYFLP